MGLCGHANDCSCAIQGNGISVAGSGRLGDPYVITPLGTHVCTSGTRPTGIQGLIIYETDTLRQLIYDGTDWVIIGGAWPTVSLRHSTTQSVAHNTAQTAVFDTEIIDDGGFHTSTNGFITIPSGMSGDYMVTAEAQYAAAASGAMTVNLLIGSPGAFTPAEYASNWGGAFASSASNNGAVVAKLMRLKAGSTVTTRIYQTSGGALNCTQTWFTANMIRHIPTLS